MLVARKVEAFLEREALLPGVLLLASELLVLVEECPRACFLAVKVLKRGGGAQPGIALKPEVFLGAECLLLGKALPRFVEALELSQDRGA